MNYFEFERMLWKKEQHIKRAEVSRQFNLADEFRSVGKGYIKGMVDCGVIEDFKPIWCWFTL